MNKKTYVTFSELMSNKKDKLKNILKLDDAVYLLLYSNKDKPIITRTVLFKELFLFYTEIIERHLKPNEFVDPYFIPYNFGPYSFTLAETLATMSYSGSLNNTGRAKSRAETFQLTQLGEKIAKSRLSLTKRRFGAKFIEELRLKRIGWDQLGRDGILRYVYTFYPEYSIMSKIKGRYIPLVKVSHLKMAKLGDYKEIISHYERVSTWAMLFKE